MYANFMICISIQSVADIHPVKTVAKVGFFEDLSLS